MPNKRNKTRFLTIILVVGLFVFGTMVAVAAPVMYVHDERGNLGLVDVVSGSVSMIGNMGTVMTDIAFDPYGNLYGLSLTTLYSINSETGTSRRIGNHGVSAGNALVFGADGTLYAAGNTSTSLYCLDKNTGTGTPLGNMRVSSGGDLAFHDGNFYLASSNSELVIIDLVSQEFVAGIIGAFGVSNMFGLATGDDGVLYGVAGTTIYTIDTQTGAALNPVSFAGQGLGNAYGQSFFTEAGADPDMPATIPEPSSMLLAATGLGVLFLVIKRKKMIIRA